MIFIKVIIAACIVLLSTIACTGPATEPQLGLSATANPYNQLTIDQAITELGEVGIELNACDNYFCRDRARQRFSFLTEHLQQLDAQHTSAPGETLNLIWDPLNYPFHEKPGQPISIPPPWRHYIKSSTKTSWTH